MGHAAAAAGSGQTGVIQKATKSCRGLVAVVRVVREASGVVAVPRVAVTTSRHQTSSGRRVRASRAGVGEVPAVASVLVESGETPIAVARVAAVNGLNHTSGNRRV